MIFLDVCMEVDLADTIVRSQATFLRGAAKRSALSPTHLLILVFEVTGVQLGDNVGLVVFELSLQVSDALVIVGAARFVLEVPSEACCHK